MNTDYQKQEERMNKLPWYRRCKDAEGNQETLC